MIFVIYCFAIYSTLDYLKMFSFLTLLRIHKMAKFSNFQILRPVIKQGLCEKVLRST